MHFASDGRPAAGPAHWQPGSQPAFSGPRFAPNNAGACPSPSTINPPAGSNFTPMPAPPFTGPTGLPCPSPPSLPLLSVPATSPCTPHLQPLLAIVYQTGDNTGWRCNMLQPQSTACDVPVDQTVIHAPFPLWPCSPLKTASLSLLPNWLCTAFWLSFDAITNLQLSCKQAARHCSHVTIIIVIKCFPVKGRMSSTAK